MGWCLYWVSPQKRGVSPGGQIPAYLGSVGFRCKAMN